MDMKSKGSAIRIRNCAFDLLSIKDLMDDEDSCSWELITRDLRLKSTFLYCDFNQLISNASKDEKKTLVDLANRLFHYIEEFDEAVKMRSISLTENRYLDIAVVLEEVMAWPSFLTHDVTHDELME